MERCNWSWVYKNLYQDAALICNTRTKFKYMRNLPDYRTVRTLGIMWGGSDLMVPMLIKYTAVFLKVLHWDMLCLLFCAYCYAQVKASNVLLDSKNVVFSKRSFCKKRISNWETTYWFKAYFCRTKFYAVPLLKIYRFCISFKTYSSLHTGYNSPYLYFKFFQISDLPICQLFFKCNGSSVSLSFVP